VPSVLALDSRFVGGLPLVNVLLDRLKVDRLLAKALPSSGRVSPARALGVLLRNIVLNDRQPIYTHAEWADRAEPSLIGLTEGQVACLNDDRVGRALDRLFDADRAALLTELVLRNVSRVLRQPSPEFSVAQARPEVARARAPGPGERHPR
jgi:hypothetical protein